MIKESTYIKLKRPVTPGQRGAQSIKHTHLTKEGGNPLLKKKKKKKKGIKQGGRNSNGRITVRHRSSSRLHRSKLRDCRFRRNSKDNIVAKVH